MAATSKVNVPLPVVGEVGRPVIHVSVVVGVQEPVAVTVTVLPVAEAWVAVISGVAQSEEALPPVPACTTMTFCVSVPSVTVISPMR